MNARTTRENAETYDAIADPYAERKLHRQVEPYVHDLLQLAAAHVPANGIALDIGCGHGLELPLLTDRGWNCVGLDRSTAMLRHARHAVPSPPLVQGDALRLPFADASTDLVLSLHGLVHLSPSKLPIALGEIRRVLRPGGVAATSFLTNSGTSREEVGYAPGHFRTFTFWTQEPLAEIAAAAGLRVLHAAHIAESGGTTWMLTQRLPSPR